MTATAELPQLTFMDADPYSPDSVAELAHEEIYGQVRTKLDAFYGENRYQVLQERLGVDRAELTYRGQRHGHAHYEVDQTAHRYNNSYKIHGAANALLEAMDAKRALKRVSVASTGNHGEAAAAAGQLLGLEVTVHVTSDASQAKVSLIESLGATIQKHDSLPDALEAAEIAGQAEDSVFIHPYNDLEVITGQSVMGVRLVEDLLKQGVTGRVVVQAPVGGGGFVSGLVMGSRYARECIEATGQQLPFSIEFVGVQMKDGDPARRTVENYRNGGPHKSLSQLFPTGGEDKTNDGTFAIPGNNTLPTLVSKLEDIRLVTNVQVAKAMQRLARRHRKRFEPAGALSEAGAEVWAEENAAVPGSYDNATLVTYLTGSNVTWEHYQYFMNAELADYYRKQRLPNVGTALGRAALEPGRTFSRQTSVWSSPVLRRYVAVKHMY